MKPTEKGVRIKEPLFNSLRVTGERGSLDDSERARRNYCGGGYVTRGAVNVRLMHDGAYERTQTRI